LLEEIFELKEKLQR